MGCSEMKRFMKTAIIITLIIFGFFSYIIIDGYRNWRSFPDSEISRIESMHDDSSFGKCGWAGDSAYVADRSIQEICIGNLKMTKRNVHEEYAIFTYECSVGDFRAGATYLTHRSDGNIHCIYTMGNNSSDISNLLDSEIAASPNKESIFTRFIALIIRD